MRSGLVCLLMAAGVGGAAPSVATVLDEGQVEIGADDSLVVGRDTYGRRTVDGAEDIGHPMVTLADEAGATGELLLRNAAVFEARDRLNLGRLGSALVEVGSGSRLETGSTKIMDAAFEDPFVPATSVVRVQGAGSEWINAGILEFGVTGTEYGARIEVRDGGAIRTSGANGAGRFVSSITVDGPDSLWNNAGLLGLREDASLIVQNGATAEDAAAWIGNQYYRTRIEVRDPGSVWRSGALLLSSWQDSLLVENGGRIESTSAALATETFQVASVRGTDSTWAVAGLLAVRGFDGGSRLSVEEGASVQTGSTTIGGTDVGSASISVSGVSSSFETQGLVAVRGRPSVGASLELLSGAHAAAGSLEVLCDGENISMPYGCRLDVFGSTLSVAHTASLRGNGSGGTIWHIADDGRAEVGEAVALDAAAELHLGNGILETPDLILDDGLLHGTGTIKGNVRNGGTISPGAIFGELSIDGDLEMDAGGVLSIDLGGLEAGAEHDVLSILGTSMLGGTLRVVLGEGFLPELGDTFEILTAGLMSGSFNTFVGLKLTTGRSLEVQVLPTTVRLVTVVPEPGSHLLLGIGITFSGWVRRARYDRLARRSRREAAAG